MKSIIQNEKRCLICNSPCVEEHHVFPGNPNRKFSEKYGLKVYLCPEHHRGNTGVHFNKDMMLQIKRLAQRAFESIYSKQKFMEIFGRNYLDED